jgi:hypothetical protein
VAGERRRILEAEHQALVAARALPRGIGALQWHDLLRRIRNGRFTMRPETEPGAGGDLRLARRAQEVASRKRGWLCGRVGLP